MRDNYVPSELQTLRHSAEGAFDTFRTRLARARELPLPYIAPPDPDELRAAAQRPDAPATLKAVERAVREGRTTWAMVISGRADRLPEVSELYRTGVRHLLNARPEEPEAPPTARRPKAAEPPGLLDDWDEQGPPETFMRRGW